MKFYSIGDFGGYDSVHRLFKTHYGYESTFNPDDADIVVWNGGADIGTAIYGEKPVDRYIPEHRSIRDEREIDLWESFQRSGKLLLGVCRGAQLLNCLNGGSLYQDVNRHTRDHDMFVVDTGETIQITSTHHQQMRPGPEAKIIAIANESTEKHYEGASEYIDLAKNIADGRDMEIIWYGRTHSLCIQGHPEYVPATRFASFTRELIEQYVVAAKTKKGLIECAD